MIMVRRSTHEDRQRRDGGINRTGHRRTKLCRTIYGRTESNTHSIKIASEKLLSPKLLCISSQAQTKTEGGQCRRQ